MSQSRRSARLTLMAMRSEVPPWMEFDPAVVRLGPRGEIVDLETALEDLVRRPKPLACFCDVEDGVLTVDFAARMFAGMPAHRDVFVDDPQLFDAFGPDYRHKPTLCVGRFEWMVLSFAELDAWCSEYNLMRWGCTADSLELTPKLPSDAVAAAQRAGVELVWDFRHPDRAVEPASTLGLIAIGRFDPPNDIGLCARCGQRRARFGLEWFDAREPRRPLCQQCIDEELTLEEFDTGRSLDRQRSELVVAEVTQPIETLERMAEEEAVTWALRPKPPFIRSFIERHRA